MALNSFSKFLCGAGCVTAPNLFLSLSSYNSAVSKSLEDKEKIEVQQRQERMSKQIMKLQEEIKEKNLDIEFHKGEAAHARTMVSFFNKPTTVVLSNGFTCTVQPGQTKINLNIREPRHCIPNEDVLSK